MKTEIIKIKGDWQEVVNDCRATVKKPPLGKEPSREFKRQILISEHSPIRALTVKFQWRDIAYWIAMHWKTHTWESRVNSQRPDRQSRYDRTKAPQDAPVDFSGDPNAQNLIDTWRKRLCYMASPETRQYAEDFKRALKIYEPELADVLVPNCVYRCGCPEPGGCKWFTKMVQVEQGLTSTDIQTRYDAYNCIFYGETERLKNDATTCDKTMIQLINRLIKEAVKHGGDIGGPYYSNAFGLYKAMMELRNFIGADKHAIIRTQNEEMFFAETVSAEDKSEAEP